MFRVLPTIFTAVLRLPRGLLPHLSSMVTPHLYSVLHMFQPTVAQQDAHSELTTAIETLQELSISCQPHCPVDDGEDVDLLRASVDANEERDYLISRICGLRYPKVLSATGEYSGLTVLLSVALSYSSSKFDSSRCPGSDRGGHGNVLYEYDSRTPLYTHKWIAIGRF